MNIVRFLFLILLLSIPLITSAGLFFLGIKDDNLMINSSYELTKVLFFNCFISIIGIFFILINKKYFISKKIFIYIILFFILGLISSVLSISPIDSLLFNNIKGHSFLFFLNLILLFIILYFVYDNKYKKELIVIIYISTFILSIIGIKEYFLPSFEYGNLGNRLLSTLGHPNYFSGLMLLFFPLFYNNIYKTIKKQSYKKVLLYIIHFVIILSAFILTKSMIPLGLFLLYNLYFFYNLEEIQKYKKIFLICIIGCIGFIIIFLLNGFGLITKLSSLISRFFIWETTLTIIFSDIKFFLFGSGFETLPLYFNNFKVPELYIFENIGLVADRPHNLLLNIFFHLGIFGLIGFIYFLYKNINNIYKGIINNNEYYIGLVLIFVFLLFNFANIVIYLFITIYILIIIKEKEKKETKSINVNINIFIYLLILISTIGAVLSFSYYKTEQQIYKNEVINHNNSTIFFEKINYNYISKKYNNDTILKYFNNYIPEKYYKHNINKQYISKNITKMNKICLEYTKEFNFTETYFYCGDKLLNIVGKNKNQEMISFYYNEGIKLLPDLWNNNSIYYNKWYSQGFTNDRFLHPKFGIKQKLDFININ